jgi:hypothetical protein
MADSRQKKMNFATSFDSFQALGCISPQVSEGQTGMNIGIGG